MLLMNVRSLSILSKSLYRPLKDQHRGLWRFTGSSMLLNWLTIWFEMPIDRPWIDL